VADVITKAELARELDLSRARITQLCRIGLPVRTDGKLNRAEAVAWVKANVCSWRGGWWLRKAKPAGVGQQATMPADSLTGGMDLGELPELGELPDLPDPIAEIGEAAVIDFMNEVRRTGNVEAFARLALRFGCTMQQAFAVARWFDLFLAFAFVPRDPERDYIRLHREPDWDRMAGEAGTTADPEAWQDWMNRLLEAEEPEKVGA
jgi:hypothetical protein